MRSAKNVSARRSNGRSAWLAHSSPGADKARATHAAPPGPQLQREVREHRLLHAKRVGWPARRSRAAPLAGPGCEEGGRSARAPPCSLHTLHARGPLGRACWAALLGLWPAQRSHARCDTPEILRRAANVNPAGVSLQCLSAVSPPARGARNKVATPSPSSSLRWSMDHLACAFLLDGPLSRPATFIGARTSAALIITAAASAARLLLLHLPATPTYIITSRPPSPTSSLPLPALSLPPPPHPIATRRFPFSLFLLPRPATGILVFSCPHGRLDLPL